jgi:hypothetical protein
MGRCRRDMGRTQHTLLLTSAWNVHPLPPPPPPSAPLTRVWCVLGCWWCAEKSARHLSHCFPFCNTRVTHSASESLTTVGCMRAGYGHSHVAFTDACTAGCPWQKQRPNTLAEGMGSTQLAHTVRNTRVLKNNLYPHTLHSTRHPHPLPLSRGECYTRPTRQKRTHDYPTHHTT